MITNNIMNLQEEIVWITQRNDEVQALVAKHNGIHDLHGKAGLILNTKVLVEKDYYRRFNEPFPRDNVERWLTDARIIVAKLRR